MTVGQQRVGHQRGGGDNQLNVYTISLTKPPDPSQARGLLPLQKFNIQVKYEL